MHKLVLAFLLLASPSFAETAPVTSAAAAAPASRTGDASIGRGGTVGGLPPTNGALQRLRKDESLLLSHEPLSHQRFVGSL